jgi:hypothetical protein
MQQRTATFFLRSRMSWVRGDGVFEPVVVSARDGSVVGTWLSAGYPRTSSDVPRDRRYRKTQVLLVLVSFVSTVLLSDGRLCTNHAQPLLQIIAVYSAC